MLAGVIVQPVLVDMRPHYEAVNRLAACSKPVHRPRSIQGKCLQAHGSNALASNSSKAVLDQASEFVRQFEIALRPLAWLHQYQYWISSQKAPMNSPGCMTCLVFVLK